MVAVCMWLPVFRTKIVLKRFPRLVLRFLEIVFNPNGHLRQLVLVLGVQIASFLLQRLRNQLRRGIVIKDEDECALDASETYEEWLGCHRRIEAREAEAMGPLLLHDSEFFVQLQQRASNYAALRVSGDEYGLMFHLRSELMRKQSGGKKFCSFALREMCLTPSCVRHM